MTHSIINTSTEVDKITIASAYNCDTLTCNTLIGNNNKSLNIFSLNIRSIYKNLDNLLVLLHSLAFENDVIILTECWLHANKNVPSIDNYNTYISKKYLNKSDGIVIYVRKSIKCSVVEPDYSGANFLLLHIEPDILILAVYRSPSIQCLDSFLDSLDNILRPMNSNKNVFLIGDINIDIKINNTDRCSSSYLNLLAEFGILPAHTYPTRMLNCLDHCMMKTMYPATVCVIDSCITDHLPVIISLGMSQRRIVNKNCSVIKLDIKACVSQIEALDFSFINTISDANNAATVFVDKLSNIVNMNTKVYRTTCKKRILKPWITGGLLRCIRHRDRLHKRHKTCPSNHILEITFKRYRNYCNSLLRKLKSNYEKSLLQNAKTPKDSWKAIKAIINYTGDKSTSDGLLNSNLNNIDTINKYFSQIGKQLADAITVTRKPNYNFKVPRNHNSIVLLPPDESEIEALISNLKNNCATGWDSIPVQLLKLCKNTIVPPLTCLFELCYAQGIFPDVFKRALITPVHKGGNRDDVSNYRPISVLSSLSKLLEKTLNSRLINFLESKSILANNQFGFRTSKSTDDAVSLLTDFVTTKVDENQKCIGIFLDLAKAFDTVSIPALVNKLDVIGVRGTALKIFGDFLYNRRQQVKIGSYVSSEENVVFGVPQGSILGPSLFLVYINDLCLQPLCNGKIFTYADDTAIVFHGGTWEEVTRIAENGLHRLGQWLETNLLTLNVSKTSFIQFSFSKNNLNNITIRAHSCNYPNGTGCSCLSINKVTHVKYLGVILDERLSWEPHINVVTCRTRKLIWVFKKLRHAADFSLLRNIYYALAQSILGYCIGVWGGACKTRMMQLERAQRSLLKVMTFKPFRYPSKQLYENCELLTIRQLYIFQIITKKHKQTPCPVNEYKRKRVIKNVCLPDRCRTATARRQQSYRSSYLYNKINKLINIHPLTVRETKIKVKNWLLQLNYDQTERLLLAN